MSLKDIRPALKAFLLADAAVSATVGGTRIYPVKLPQGVVTASVVYNLISEIGDVHNEGPDGLVSTRIQFDAYAPTAAEARQLADELKERLFGYRGAMGSGDAAVAVQGVFLGGVTRTEYDDAGKMYRFIRDFIVWFWDR